MSISETPLDNPEERPALLTDEGGEFTWTREEVNKVVPQRRYAYVPTPELRPGSRARVRNLNSTEISAYEASNFTGIGKKTKLTLENTDARLAAWGWVDESGKLVYNPREADEVRRVGMMDGAPISRIAKKVRELSGMSVEEDDEEDKEQGKVTPNLTLSV
jgi:hypothetical protein